MNIKPHRKVTDFSGNEIYCLNKPDFGTGQLCLGNNVSAHSFVFGNVAYSIGVCGNITGAFRGLKRVKVTQYTRRIQL